ncbi:MAG: hypothetical protein ACQESP_09765 [Candidatus Muiribacteriota bacterium]
MNFNKGNIIPGLILIFGGIFLAVYIIINLYSHIEIIMYPDVKADVILNEENRNYELRYRISTKNFYKSIPREKASFLKNKDEVNIYYLPDDPETIFFKPVLSAKFFIVLIAGIFILIWGMRLILISSKR